MDLRVGDRMLVHTQNSVYEIHMIDEDSYLVSGGWFNRTGQPSVRVSITGCTWDGRLFDRDLLAAQGMRLQFGNTVITSPIRDVNLLRNAPSIKNRSTTNKVKHTFTNADASKRSLFPWKHAKKPLS